VVLVHEQLALQVVIFNGKSPRLRTTTLNSPTSPAITSMVWLLGISKTCRRQAKYKARATATTRITDPTKPRIAVAFGVITPYICIRR
jgi:hypothetical protein